ncbi:glycosyltransferase [bacterium]|nr:glycosyltransferase [bacterium]
MSKIKILFAIPNFDTCGSGKAMLNIASTLDKDKFEAHILCNHDRGDFFKTVKNSGLKIHVFQYIHPISISGFFRILKVARLIRSINPDIVHSFNYASEFSEGLAVRLAGSKWVYTKKNMAWQSKRWKVRTWLANGIVVQNTDMMKNFFNGGSDATTLCPRGVNIPEFRDETKAVNLQEEFGVSKDARVIMTVANLRPGKGVETLLEAFLKLRAKIEDIQLVIVGEDKNITGDNMKAGLKNHEFEKDVFFTDRRTDIAQLLKSADYFVLPSLANSEGTPVALLEAMSSGLPVIASDIAGIRDQLVDLPNQMVEPGNVDELVQKLESLLSHDNAERKKVIEKQYEVLYTKFSIEREMKDHADFYLKLMKK